MWGRQLFAPAARVSSARLAPVPVRCFAASTKPAIQLFGVSGRYATALYQVAAENGALADVEAELTGIAALRDSSPQFANFMDDPTLSVSQRTGTMDAIMAKGGYSETTAKFFGVVIENRRLPDLAKITDDFLKLTAADRSELTATVTAAAKVTPKQMAALQKALSAHPEIGKGNEVRVIHNPAEHVDPSLVGGMVVEIEDGGDAKVIDLSTKKQLSEMQQLLG